MNKKASLVKIVRQSEQQTEEHSRQKRIYLVVKQPKEDLDDWHLVKRKKRGQKCPQRDRKRPSQGKAI